MSTFIKPISGSSTKKGDNVLEYAGYPMQDIKSPYYGEVVSVSSSKCGGYIEIKHNFNGSNIYSNFCGVSTILVTRGDNVYTGQKVGYFGSSPVEYYLSSGFFNLDTKSYFGSSESSTGDIGSSKIEKSEKPKAPKTTNNNLPKSSGGAKFEKKDSLTIGHQVMADMLSAPLNIFRDAHFFKMTPKLKNKIGTKESEEKDFKNLLIEEINRMKKLF